jgi:hypothetical protein
MPKAPSSGLQDNNRYLYGRDHHFQGGAFDEIVERNRIIVIKVCISAPDILSLQHNVSTVRRKQAVAMS